MKTKTVALIALIGLVMSSCLVKSLHPFYKENDLYFDNSLIGTWSDKDSGKWYVKQIFVSYGEGQNKKEYKNKGYVVGHVSKKKDSKAKSYDVFLFKINGQVYADFCNSLFPNFESIDDDLIDKVRTHNLAKVDINNDELTFAFFNGEWLAELIETNKIKIAHEFVKYPEPISIKYKGEYVLTASTDELQKFLAKYGNDPKAFAARPMILPNGRYGWTTGNDEFTGKMTFGENANASIKLKKLNEK